MFTILLVMSILSSLASLGPQTKIVVASFYIFPFGLAFCHLGMVGITYFIILTLGILGYFNFTSLFFIK